MKKILFALTVTLIITVLFCFTASADDEPYDKPVGTVFMQYGTPLIDGKIENNEGWGKSAHVYGGNLVPIMVQSATSYPNADICFAYDENYFYFAADVTDEDYIINTGFFVDNYVSNLAGKRTSFFAFDGDVLALAFDWNNLIASDIGYLTDRPSFFCFGLFKDGHIGAYHTNLNEKDLTDVVKAKGSRTTGGWRFEAAVPWSEIGDDIDANSFGNLKFDYDEMTSPNADNKVCVYLVDRFDDIETGETELDNIYATYEEYTHEGGISSHYDYFFYGVFGIDLKATKNGGQDVTVNSIPTSLVWVDPFTDLNKNAWYYKAVSECCDRELFSGTQDTTFTPSGKLTRAMMVTVLAKLARYDGTDATGTMYIDVPANKWYSVAVEWATRNGISSGTGEGCFNPNAYLTREQAAVMLYRFAQFKRFRTDVSSEGISNGFPDGKYVSEWAVTAIEWALQNKLISGTKKADATYLDPKGTATRAQCAQIIYTFNNTAFTHFAKEGEYTPITLLGYDISEYSVIYGSEAQDKTAAQELVKYIYLTSGITVSSYRDTEKEETEKEIIIGKTNRENEEIKIDRADIGAEEFAMKSFSEKTKLIITGGEKKGTLFGVYWFIEEYLGWVYGDGECESRYYTEKITVDGDITEKHGSIMKQLSLCEEKTDSVFRNKIALYGETMQCDDAFQCGIAYLYANLDWDKFVAIHKDKNPCFSNPETVEFITAMILKRMEREPNQNVFSLGAFDNNLICTCEECVKVYREEKSRGGTYMRMTNRVAQAVKEKYPENRLIYMAYNWSTDVTVTAPADNVIVRFVNIAACFHHNINDPDCPHNRPLYNNLLVWNEKCDTLWLGEHGGTFRFRINPVMNFEFLYTNVEFYNDIGCSGFIYWSNDGNTEFYPTRDYLLAHLFRYPNMTYDEYRILMEANFEARYGKAWRDMIEYTDIMKKTQEYVHFSSHPSPEGTLTPELFDSKVDVLDALWENMYSVTEKDSVQYSNLDTTFVNYLFIRQTVEWEKEYRNGSESDKAEYFARNKELYTLFNKYSISWSEQQNNPNNVNFEKSPSTWE